MKNKDAEIGMKVKRIWKDHKDVKKGSVYTIANTNNDNEVRLEGLGNYWYDLNLFEPVVMELEQSKDEPTNKFEVGDEVLIDCEDYTLKGTVFGECEKIDEYAVYYKHPKDGEIVTQIFKEEKLSQLKKKDELEVGDKFKVETATGTTDRINQVLGVFKDDKYNQIKYAAKRVQGDWKGYVDIYNSESIAEIIYD